MNKKRGIFAGGIVIAIATFLFFDLNHYLTLDYVQNQREALVQQVDTKPVATGAVFFGLYVAITALSLPGAAIMTLAAGAVFGVVTGTVLVSFASSIGATFAFLASRWLLRGWVENHFQRAMNTINDGIRREGAFYLFTLRLIPLFPFFVINLAMGLTRLRVPTFYWVSQLGMLPGTVVYVNAGTQLAQVNAPSDLTSPSLLAAFALLGLFPLLARRCLQWARRHHALRGYRKPRHFDRNLIVIGGGSAGLVAAYIAATVKAGVTLIEKHEMGGDCLNTGCVPSKALLRSARFAAEARRAQALGFKPVAAECEFDRVMKRVRRVINAVEPHDSPQRYRALGVDCIHGQARITSPYSVSVDGRELTTRAIVVATGATPFVPPLPGIDQVPYLTSDTLWTLETLPATLVILGGGPIGCEMAQAFARLGSTVTLVERGDRLLARESEAASALIAEVLREEGVMVATGHTAHAVAVSAGKQQLICKHGDTEVPFFFDKLLIALGRRANTHGLGLEAVGVSLREDGTIATDDYLRTHVPTIFASGDVTGPYQFTHVAAHQSWYAAVNALFGFAWKFRVDYRVIPRTTFTDPEVASVGLNQNEAARQAIACEVTRFDLNELDRALTDDATCGFVEVLTPPGKDTILGATVVSHNAGEILPEFVLAMKHKIGLNKLLGTIHTYPTLAEANKYAAGAWKKAHAPHRLLQWLHRLHRWRR